MANRHLGAALALTVGLLAPVGVQAQDSLQAAERPQRHVVQVGETLWGLAQLYLGDPFLWPEIYRINTGTVEDPHWIFPGEELFLVPSDHTEVAVVQVEAQAPVQQPGEAPPPVVADTLAVQQEAQPRVEQQEVVELPVEALPETPPPPATNTATVFARRSVAEQAMRVIGGRAETYRGLRVGDFYGSGFLTEGEDLPFGAVQGVADLGTARAGESATAMIYANVRVAAPQGAAYQVGDSLLTVRLGGEVNGGWGRIVKPTGLMRVVSVDGQDVVGLLLVQFDQVRAGQLVLPAEPFPRVGTGRPQPVSGGIEGVVLARAQRNPVPNQYNVLFIDLGRSAGVTPGDVFEILSPDYARESLAAPQVLGEAQVVHVRERSSTLVITRIFTPGIRTANRATQDVPVRLVGKMPA
jgi:LysM repeat protein